MNAPIRIRTTWLNAYDYAAEHGIEGDELLQGLLGGRETAAMKRGKDFEAWLEHWPHDPPTGLHWHTAPFADPVHLPRVSRRQGRVEKGIVLPCQDLVVLTGTIDAEAEDGSLIDWKTTSRAPSYESYADQWQWRSYLWMANRQKFAYHVFLLSDLPKREIRSHTVFEFYGYPDMGYDVTQQAAKVYALVQGWLNDGKAALAEDGNLYLPETDKESDDDDNHTDLRPDHDRG